MPGENEPFQLEHLGPLNATHVLYPSLALATASQIPGQAGNEPSFEFDQMAQAVQNSDQAYLDQLAGELAFLDDGFVSNEIRIDGKDSKKTFFQPDYKLASWLFQEKEDDCGVEAVTIASNLAETDQGDSAIAPSAIQYIYEDNNCFISLSNDLCASQSTQLELGGNETSENLSSSHLGPVVMSNEIEPAKKKRKRQAQTARSKKSRVTKAGVNPGTSATKGDTNSAAGPSRNPSHNFEAHDSALQAEIAQRVAKPVRPRYKKGAPPSKYCHVCGRNSKTVFLAACGNIKISLCTKVVCSKCLILYDPSFNWTTSNPTQEFWDAWRCTHCKDNCPSKARCHQYQNSNAKRKLKSVEAQEAKEEDADGSIAIPPRAKTSGGAVQDSLRPLCDISALDSIGNVSATSGANNLPAGVVENASKVFMPSFSPPLFSKCNNLDSLPPCDSESEFTVSHSKTNQLTSAQMHPMSFSTSSHHL